MLKRRRRTRIVFLFLVVLLVVITLDWGIKYLLLDSLGIQPEVFNDKDPQIWTLPFFFVLSGVLFWLAPWGLTALACGFLGGGLCANLIDRALFGPVADYIPAPSDYWCNFADLALLTGFLLGMWFFVAFIRDGRRPVESAS